MFWPRSGDEATGFSLPVLSLGPRQSPEDGPAGVFQAKGPRGPPGLLSWAVGPAEPHAEQREVRERLPLTLVGDGMAGGATGEARDGVGTTGAARGVCAGVLGSLLLISPAEAEAEPESPVVPLDAAELAVRVGWAAVEKSGERMRRGCTQEVSGKELCTP